MGGRLSAGHMSCTPSVSVQLYKTWPCLQDSAAACLWVSSHVRRPEMEDAAEKAPSVPTWSVSMLATPMKMIKNPLRTASNAARAALISLGTASNGGLTHLHRDGGH